MMRRKLINKAESGCNRTNAFTVPASLLADVWGVDIQRLLWDAMLDEIEAAIAESRCQRPTDQVTLEGFLSGPDELRVRLLAGIA